MSHQLKIFVVVLSLSFLSACGGGGSPPDSASSGSTIVVNYSKGPVTGATALLKDTNGNTVAGPVITVNGQASFENVMHTGPVYTVFSGGSYTDEATGAKVILDSDFEIRSGVVNNTRTGTLALTATPLTEIGFQRAVMQNGGSVNLDTVNNQIQYVADEYGLDDVDLTNVAPTALENITGSSDEDRYGAILAAISQQQLSSSQTPDTEALENYIISSANTFDRSALTTAISDLQSNPVTKDFINTAVVNDITIRVGRPNYSLGGDVSGLIGSVTLQASNGDDLTVNANGTFAFSNGLQSGFAYAISITVQPAGQVCSISNATGTVSTEDVTNIAVNCNGASYRIGGAISGLTGSISLQNNGINTLIAADNGNFDFAIGLMESATYSVSVSVQPAGQTCSISNGSGIVSGADVTNVVVSCAALTYSIGGEISGLRGILALQINGVDTLSTTNDGRFNFASSLTESSTYNVIATMQPSGIICDIVNGSGTVGTEDVNDIEVNCKDNVNFVWFSTGGSPIGNYWYNGDKQWVRETEFDSQGLTEIGSEGSLITLSNEAEPDPEIFEIDLEALTVTSNQNPRVYGVLEFGCRERSESSVICPPPPNDHTPVMTSADQVTINSGKEAVLILVGADADFPDDGLYYSLTDNPATDNHLFNIGNFEENSRAACRAGTNNEGHTDDPSNANYFFVEEGASSLEECQDVCNEYPIYGGLGLSCRGIEYRSEGVVSEFPEPRCEIWTTRIIATVPQPGYGCYERQSERPTVLSFINAPDFRVQLDANADNIYVVEVEVSEGEDGKSSTQVIEITVIPNGDYLGRSGTACRAGFQNEGHPEDPNNSRYFTITNGVNSLQDCQTLCNAYPLIDNPGIDCTGVEYRTEDADYADTQSRCELWKVPIAAFTPQKEYACYVKELVRSEYGPDTDAFVDTYKAIGTDENSGFVTTAMTLTQLSSSELTWTEGGNSWTVSRTADRNKLAVGDDYPYKGDGYEEPSVYWDANEITGIVGPSGRIYRTDWAHAKLSHSQTVYSAYIDNYPSELIRVEEAQRQIRELKWAIAEQINTAAAYRAYKNDIDGAYGRTQEADRRIGNISAHVTAEVLQIEVDSDVSASPEEFGGENNDLELFYNLEFTKSWRARADEPNWSTDDLILTSVTQSDGSKITNINDSADRAFKSAGYAEKTIIATENETLRYGGLMFEVDTLPNFNIPDCEDFDQSGSCKIQGLEIEQFFSDMPTWTSNGTYPLIEGVFDDYHWAKFGDRTWAGNAATANESLDSSYFSIAMEDLEYNVPKIKTKSIKFESDEEIHLKYEITKRTEEQYNEFIDANVLSCDDLSLKREKLTRRSLVAIDAPGFLVRNETDHTYSVSLNQVGPLYYQELRPGKVFRRDTAWGHFTIDALLNMTGEQRYSDWDVAGPIVQFTAEVLLSVVTGGTPITKLKTVISAGARSAGAKVASTTAARAGASALGRTAFGRATLRTGGQALKLAADNGHKVVLEMVKKGGRVAATYTFDEALDEYFTQDLADNIYTEDNTEEYISWAYSGAFSSPVEMYHIVGGPRLPCLNADGDIEIRADELQILDDEECAKSSLCSMR
jgi:hypothetical protein